MSWETVLANAGIAGVVVVVLLKAHRDLIYNILPSHLDEIEGRLAEIERKQQKRHKENRRDARRLCEVLQHFTKACGHARAKKKRQHRSRAKSPP